MNKDFIAFGAMALVAAALMPTSVVTDAKNLAVTKAGESGIIDVTPTVTPDPITTAEPTPSTSSTTAKSASTRTTSSASATQAAPAPGSYGTKNGHDHYALTDTGGGAAAGWSSCAPVRVVINPKNAPKGAVNDMKVALQRMKTATGLDIQYLGTTNATTKEAWGYSSQAGFDGWPPVLISWGKPGDPGTKGLQDISAFAEPSWRANSNGTNVMVSGRIVFNTDEDAAYSPGFGSEGSRVALQMHEFGHILGLEHVQDEEQLMYPTIYARDLGAGDLTGLKKLSSTCHEAPAAP